jgi:o-succinylbenzoate synthase
MNPVRARLHRFALPLRTPLETAHGRIQRREGFLVEIEDADGVRGFGEAAPLPDFGTESATECLAALRAGLGTLLRGPRGEGFEPEGPLLTPASSDRARLRVSATPCADHALETARMDLSARRAGCRLADLLADVSGRARPGDVLRSQVLVSGSTPEAVASAAAVALAEGATAFKLKVALGAEEAVADPSRDVDRVAALRDTVGPAATVRLDANEGWSESAAQEAFVALAPFGIEYVEQPVPRTAIESMARLTRAGVIEVAADEALLGMGWQACLEARAASVWILKPGAVGGLELAAARAERAGADGIRTVWSNLIESAVGRAAAASLAAVLGAPEEVHGLGTASWLAQDLHPDDGRESAHRIQLRPDAGLGFTPRIEERGLRAGGLGLEGEWRVDVC